jgi:molybdopterin molybdotransferase
MITGPSAMKKFIGFREALELTLAHVSPGAVEDVPLLEAGGRILAEPVAARVDSPSLSTSRKDGYAVISEDLRAADTAHPRALKLLGSLAAGGTAACRIRHGETVRVTTGARLPEGSDAVLTEEFCRVQGETVICLNTAEPGRNILARGTDVAAGETVAEPGMRLDPPLLGLIAAAGRARVKTVRPPRAAVIATGDEVLAPGEPLAEGALYASNLVEICAFLTASGMPFESGIVKDRHGEISAAIEGRLDAADVFLTSGGAWGSEKDLILKVVETMDWNGVYHRVRIGPGKPVGFGLLYGKPFFVLPGGPPSNEMAFLQLALPALLRMAGAGPQPFPWVEARLTDTVTSADGWTEFVHARLEEDSDGLRVRPARLKSRLKSMAQKQALIVIPEERSEIPCGEVIRVQLLDPKALS